MAAVSIHVKVHPAASQDAIVPRGPSQFEVWVRAKPVDGRASDAVARLLAGCLHVLPSQVRLVRGQRSRQKVFEVLGLTHRTRG